ncbi:heparan-alpha-glucosaminide N-acetyltransferase-like [Cimex lectularius]|uniref:Heparan-alpha-glucosaminide N-acetyltransferase catalytic domain-containing protein n=1 Tax=Cimex lectularius TaxID=79782 RepID=A0A8I6TCU3_CIMLE|nr:heparan-alpha-glucosaminide N-acetyltransferase-like [Cimex lectularius]XP_024082438.1 heparan-alpha-glucosaminide N-acetyltransferase-like [Cimex lectularius]
MDNDEMTFNTNNLGIDEAFVKITTDSFIHLYKLVDECYKCPFTYVDYVNDTRVLKASTKFGTSFRLYTRKEPFIGDKDVQDMVCEVRPRNFGPFGVYDIQNFGSNCTIATKKSPTSQFYLPLYVTALVLFIITLIWNIATSKGFRKEGNDDQSEKRSKRLASLDAFRGMCIVLMIFVNDGSGGYEIIDHTTWNGLHLADVLFPWFLWIMGVCIPISIKSQIKRKVRRWKILTTIVQRSLILFILGLMLNSIGKVAQLETFRLFGVLQRFSVSYFVVSTLVTLLMVDLRSGRYNFCGPLTDVVNLSIIWVLMVLLVAGQTYLVFFYPVPNCPTGYLGPGGLHQDKMYEHCIGGFSGYFDKLVLRKEHLFQNPTANQIYHSGPFEPEGPFGCLLTIFQVFLGVQAGVIILTFSDGFKRIKRWLIWGVVVFIFGVVLCQGRIEGGWIPINKNLWSLSFVFLTSGLAFLLFSLFYYLIDHLRCWTGSPFIYPGMNSILLYIGHEVAYDLFPWHWRFGPMNNHLIVMLEAVWGTLLWVLISYVLYKKKIFLKL